MESELAQQKWKTECQIVNPQCPSWPRCQRSWGKNRATKEICFLRFLACTGLNIGSQRYVTGFTNNKFPEAIYFFPIVTKFCQCIFAKYLMPIRVPKTADIMQIFKINFVLISVPWNWGILPEKNPLKL